DTLVTRSLTVACPSFLLGCRRLPRSALFPYTTLFRSLLEAPVIYMDETTVQVLKEPGRSPTAKSYMWVQRGGPPGRTAVLFDYDTSRSGKVPLRLLEGLQG